MDDVGSADFQTIQEAMNGADVGDTIYVRAGTYYENVILNKSSSLVGENTTSTARVLAKTNLENKLSFPFFSL